MSGRGSLHSTLVGDPGDAPVVVFCHGLFGRGRNFSTIGRALRPERASLLVDLPNHGASAWTERVDFQQMADLLADHLLDGVARDRQVALVGHSMGGKVAMTLTLSRPELVERLVVVDISPTPSTASSEFDHLLGALRRIDLSAVRSLGDADRALSADVPQRGLRGFLLQNLRRDPSTGRFAWQPNLDLLHEDLPVITRAVPHGDRRYDGPVLWVAGSESDYVTDADAPLMRALFPRTRLVTVKGAGHWVHSEQPTVFTAALRSFLASRQEAGEGAPG